jgi:hypothetical protein
MRGRARGRIQLLSSLFISGGIVAAILMAPSAYLWAAYDARTTVSIACGPSIGCVRNELTSYTKSASWLPGPDRLPTEAARHPFRYLTLEVLR